MNACNAAASWYPLAPPRPLQSCPVLRDTPPDVIDWLRAGGDLYPFAKGQSLTGLLAGGGFFIVVLGTVRVRGGTRNEGGGTRNKRGGAERASARP